MTSKSSSWLTSIVRGTGLLLFTLFVVQVTWAADDSILKARLRAATLENSLETDGMKPWHLLVSFQLFDDKGQPTEKGTVEEWWSSPTAYKITYASPSYNNTEIVNKEGHFKLAPDSYTPELLDLLRTQIGRPLPNEDEVAEAELSSQKKDFGKVATDCVTLGQHIKNVSDVPLGLFPTYCLDRDKTSLRLTSNYGTMLTVRNTMGTFLSKSVPMKQTILLRDVTAATGHIEQLTTMPIPLPEDLFVSAGMIKTKPEITSFPAVSSADHVLVKINPIYPESAKINHVSGAVTFKAYIGTDGRIHSLKLLSTPDADLAIASFAAVRQWTYRPFVIDGVPSSVDTTITVNFRIGPH